MFGLNGYFSAQAGQGHALAEILKAASALMLEKAKGCRLYLVALDQEVPDRVWVIEAWDSPEDHRNSLQVAGVAELIGRARPLMAEGSQQHRLDLLTSI